MNPTIRDVSKLSGVSTATVSRTFFYPERVKKATREKVLEAARVLNYSPNAIARAMALQRTDKIAFLICKAHSSILDEFYAGICEGIMKESNAYDYQLLISTEEDWIAATNSAKRKQIEGVILGGNAKAERVLEFQNQNIHVVMVNNRIAGMNLPYVLSDERDGTRQAVQHLVERGHQKIAMIAGRFSPYICSERYNAFLDAMNEHGLKVESRYIRMSDPNIESAVEVATALLRQKDPPTAIFGANDVIAVGAIKAALRLGLRIPRDVAIVGYDDSSICCTTEPELTSVHIDRMRMGQICVQKLQALMRGEEIPEQVTVLPTWLNVRGSS